MSYLLKRVLIATSLLSMTLIASCSSQPRESSFKILKGSPTLPGTAMNVVAIATAAGDFFCTGVLVTERLVLTAAHCLHGRAPYDHNIRVVIGNGNDSHHFDETQLLPVTDGKFADTYKGQADADIGYLLLKNPLTEAAHQIVPLALDHEDVLQLEKPKQKLRLIGYGCRDQQINCKAGVKHQVDIEINTVSQLSMDVGTTDAGASNGDSGGPAFALLPDGSQRLMGVTSGRGRLGTNYVLIRPYICWINRESKVEIPGAASHCYNQALIEPKTPEDLINACKSPANAVQTHTFAALNKEQSDCKQLIETLKTVQSLDLSNAYFTDLTALKFADQLKHLDLTGHRQTSLVPLEAISSLESVVLDLTRTDATQLKALHTNRPQLRVITTTANSDLFAGIESSNEILFELALDNSPDLDIKTTSGLTPLQRAAELKRHAFMEKIIARGANLDVAEPKYGHTALHLAVFSNDLASVQLLVDHHANCFIKNMHGNTALDIAELYNRGSALQKYLIAHCKR